jgi:hypothetical protein
MKFRQFFSKNQEKIIFFHLSPAFFRKIAIFMSMTYGKIKICYGFMLGLMCSVTAFAQETNPLPEPVVEEAELAPVTEPIFESGAVPEPEAVSEPVPEPAPVVALPKLSVAQALRSSSLPKGCVEDFTNLLEGDGFNMTNFAKELPPAVAKVKLQMKSPFGKPKDDDKTGVGLTVGCIKALPESPAEIQGLLKDISLKAGLNLAMDVAVDAAKSIPANVETEVEEGSSKALPIVCFAAGGLAILYGFVQDRNVSDYVKKREGKKAVDAESSRNMGYGIGLALLAGGAIIYIAF